MLKTEEKKRKHVDQFVLSIDTKNARALDDALSVRHLEGSIYQVGIHISDVAAIVKQDSAIDLEAQSRIASTYILKKFHKPMLPHYLNENVCCLKANSEKLAVTLWVNLDAETGIIDYSSAKYEKTIINN